MNHNIERNKTSESTIDLKCNCGWNLQASGSKKNVAKFAEAIESRHYLINGIWPFNTPIPPNWPNGMTGKT